MSAEHPSNWAAANANLVDQLVCPCCDAANDPIVKRIFLDGIGNAACDQCGHKAPMQTFLPPLERME